MNVYQKLINARIELQDRELKKTGENKYAGFKYFELGDFLPAAQEIFFQQGLCGVVSYGPEEATLTIVNTENPEDWIVIKSPMSSIALKGNHEIQNLGAIQTYLRRYLWVTALEIVEHDVLDAVVNKPDTKEAPKPKKAEEPKKTETASGVTISTDFAPKDSWEIKIANKPEEGQIWLDALWTASAALLEFAKSDADVMSIFKTNKDLFDAAKEYDAIWFKKLMAEFTKTKEKLKG